MVSTRRMAAVGAVLMLAAACGTTAKNAGGKSSPSGGSSAGVGGSVSASGGQTPGSSTPGGSSGGALSGSGSSSGGLSSSGSASSGSSSGNSIGGASSGPGPVGAPTSKFVAASAPGITNQTMYIGIGYSSSEGAADKAIGAAGAAPSYDARNVWNTSINYANSHGGFAGRTLQAIYYDDNVASDQTTQDQAACADYTQDHKVFAIITQTDLEVACAQNAGAIAEGAPGGGTEATFQKYPHLVDPDGIAFDRLGSLTVNGLFNAGYFTGKLGLVTWDDPNYRAAVTNGYLPALSSHHISPAQTVYISVPQQLGAVADMSAAVGSAVTKFKSLGIDHVIIQDGSAGVWAGDGLTLEWMDQAKSQGYYPRYGQNGYNNPGTTLNPSDQQNKALSINQIDYDPSYDTGWHANSARTSCFQIQARAGFPVSASNPEDEVTASFTCDYIFFLQRVVNGLSQITADAFMSQAQTVGTAFSTAEVYGSKLVSGRRDGADEVRNAQYLSSCSCLKFQGAPYYAD